jgi:pyruvate dehydrogenase E2 component (dihydrolipoamide acetyltransferase)
MAIAVLTPRINNNDDYVRLVAVYVKLGDSVRPGQVLAEVETDKANFSVESEHEGYVIHIGHETQQNVAVGSVLMWLGSSPDEPAPVEAEEAVRGESNAPTLKALLLLSQYGLAQGARLTAADVQMHVERTGLGKGRQLVAAAVEPKPESPGRREVLSPMHRGMIRTVEWHRDYAVPGYVEIPFPARDWAEYAEAYQVERRMLMSPLLGLIAYRLAKLAVEHPRINSTIADGQHYLYDRVDLGFTVQTPEGLFLAVVKDAGSMEAGTFVNRLGLLQRNAMRNKLKPEETQGATIGFSSMARWGVSRHMPVLAPNTSLMVAHAESALGAVLGATYDHRVLSGGDAAEILNLLARRDRD